MNQAENQNPHEEADAYDRREARAYATYEREYLRRHPRPEKPSAAKKLPAFWWVFALIALAGSLLAAERTVSVYAEIAALTAGHAYIAYGVGVVAFVVVDGGAISFRFARIWLTYRYAPSPPPITAWVSRGAVFAFAAQLIAQLYGVREIVSWLPAQVEDGMQLLIALAAALSGMVLAFVTGEILAVLSLQAQHDSREAEGRYDKEIDAWRDGLSSAWDAERPRRVGARPRANKRATAMAQKIADSAPDRRPDRRPDSLGKPSPKQLEVLTLLSKYPEWGELSVRELSARTGVNHDDVSKALRRYKTQLSAALSGHNHNGHRAGEGEG